MNAKSSLLLFATCVTAIGATGCVFELAYGQPRFGVSITWALLILSIPVTVALFVGAVQAARAAQK